MLMPLRLAHFLAGCLAVSTQLLAATELVQVRSGVGVVGRPVQLSGNLDVNGNGRPELLVAARWHVSFVEEDAGPRGYREVARLDGPESSSFRGAMLVDVAGADKGLLLHWAGQLELRDAATLDLRATRPDVFFGQMALGDVDGDGLPEIVIGDDYAVKLLDANTLESRGNLALGTERLAVANIVGDDRAEIISEDARAYTVTRSGAVLSATEVWNAGISGEWNPYVVDFDGHAAIVLHDTFGFTARLATFWPTPSLRALAPGDGPSFRPLFADVNGDGRVDFIMADNNRVRALDMASGVTLWERDTIYQAPYIGSVYSPITTELDGDGIIDLVWADASNDSGVVAIAVPLAGLPRWRSDFNQSRIIDWAPVRNAEGRSLIAYLTRASQVYPRLRTIGFLDGAAFTDYGGSSFSWLPGYTGFGATKAQHAITSLPLNGHEDAVAVSGAEYPMFGGNPLSRWLWTFDGNGALLSARALMTSIDPERIAAEQVLDRPERQLVVAGRMPQPASGPSVTSMRVEIVDYATGDVLWQSAVLPTYDGASMTQLEVADLDADGDLEIVAAYGTSIAILKPSASPGIVAEHGAQRFSLLDRGLGHNAMIAMLNGTDVAIYDGLSGVPEKTFELPEYAYCIALFTQGSGDNLMFATGNYVGTTVRRYADGGVVTSNWDFPNLSLAAIDIDGDHQIELIGSDLNIWRLDDSIFRDGFDAFIP
jgi:hypothetical protein